MVQGVNPSAVDLPLRQEVNWPGHVPDHSSTRDAELAFSTLRLRSYADVNLVSRMQQTGKKC